MTSASRIEPPGWTNAVTPAARHDLDAVGEREERVRGTGRADRSRRPGDRPRLVDGLAGGVDAARLARARARPAGRPGRARSRSLEAPRTSRQARSRSRRSASVGPRRVTTAQDAGSSGRVVGRADEDRAAGRPDRAERVRQRGAGRPRRATDRRPGAGSASPRGSPARRRRSLARRRPRGRSPLSARASSPSTTALSATTPPNADTGSPARAASQAARSVAPLGGAARVGVLDDDAAPGRAASRASAAAADASRTLL